MRTNWTRMALAAAMLAVGVSAPIAGIAQTASEARVDLKLQDAPMQEAIKILMQRTGISVVFESSNDAFPAVTMTLVGVTAEQGLRYICDAAKVHFRRDENGVYIITRTAPTVKPNEEGISIPPPTRKTKLYRMTMRSADAQDVLLKMLGRYEWDPNRSVSDINEFASMQARFRADQIMPGRNSFDTNPTQPKQFDAMPTNATPERPVTAGSNGVTLPGEEAPQGGLGGLGGGGGGLGGGGQQGGGIGGGQGGQGGGQLSAGGLIPQSVDFITFDPVTNSILIRTDEATWRDLQGLVDQFDVSPQQVDVRVQFVTTTSSQSKSLGFDWLFTRGTISAGNAPGSFASSGDPIFLSYATGNIQTRLRTFLQDGFGRVVASPSVRTMSNQSASVSQSTATTIFIPQNFISNGTQFTQYTPLQLTASSVLNIRPRVNADGSVTMILQTGIQQFGQLRRSPDGQTIPDITQQALSVAVKVRSGDTVAMAGFTNKSDLGSQSKFPILGDLPLIGQFFRKTISDKSVQELLIFVTPTIVDEEASIGQ